MNHTDLVTRNKAYTLGTWVAQKSWNPISMVRGDGVYFWDADGKRYLDWSSQLVNVNIGHGHPHVIKAIQDQIGKLSFAHPGIATEPRARLGEMLQQIVPVERGKAFFTLAGADAIENAIKMARLFTGRQKVFTRFRSYHGATFGAMTAGGDPRRWANEPGVPWIVHIHDPYPYRSPLYRGRTEEEGDAVLADLIEETVMFEGPQNVAAFLLEGYSGSSGIIQGSKVFWNRIQQMCDRYDILLIVDEVLSGFGRTGEWFGINHYPDVKPDLVVMAKGITSGYAPLGAVMASERVAKFFEDHVLWAGLTYGAHPLSCAAAIANLEVYQAEKLIENSREMGKILRRGLVDLAERHPCVGDVRGIGLQQVIELVKNQETREPISGWNRPPSEAMQKAVFSLREQGMSTFVQWDFVFSCPPLVIQKKQIEEGLRILDNTLETIDTYCK
jgi:taurine--2-oxoglutarate transaminase